MVITGTVYINPSTTATTANGILMVAGNTVEFVASNNLSYISDGNAATIQVIFWD
jgi:hypothetical protein